MKILFLVYHGFSEVSGISKKIHYQVKGLRENGYEVHLCYYDFAEGGHRCRFVDGRIIKDYGVGKWAALRQRLDYGCVYDYCISEGIEFVYARCFQNANPWLIRFFKRLRKAGIHAVTEIPTYPYDQEFATSDYGLDVRLGLWLDQRYRRRLYQYMDAMVTFTDEKRIFGQRTVNISNGVDFDSIPLHHFTGNAHEIHLIGVAEVHYWHGFDRLVAGLGEYYATTEHPRPVFFHIVGGVHPMYMNDFDNIPGFAPLIEKYGIQDKVFFHGTMFGQQLDEVFNLCQFAIGSLGRHRSGITVIKTLKNREYATRGIPFIYSEQDSDFDHQPYVLKAPADETPIDVRQIVDFIDVQAFSPANIRKTVEHLTWKIQMKRVVDAVMTSAVSTTA